jgi:integrase/recombinase XerD
MQSTSTPAFDRLYQTHLKHLKLKGLQPKTIEAYARAIRRVGEYFDHQIEALTEAQLTDYFTDLLASHSWSAVKLDLYGLKFFYSHVLHKPWIAPDLVKPPKAQRLPDIVTVAEAQRLFQATQVVSYRVFFSPSTAWACAWARGCACKWATSMRRGDACISAMPRATRTVWCLCRRRH